MNNKEMALGLGGFVLGVLLILIIGPSVQLSRTSMPYGSKPMMGNLDQHFIEQMIPHHEGAISMANVALTKANYPEIKTLATAIIDAQQKEIDEMNSWYKDWFGKNPPKNSMMGGMMSGSGMHMGGSEEMAALANAANFDKAFIEQMIPHHQMAVMMAQMLEAGTQKPEMKNLAKNIIESQSAEIEQMQGWYETWY